MQVILKPTPDDVIDQYLGSLKAIGIDLRKHDIKLEEDNWEAPTLGAWGVGWQVMLDGLEITQVHRHQSGGAAGFLDLIVGFFQTAHGAGDTDHMRTGSPERDGGGAADAARGAGDERDAILEALCRQPTSARKESCFCTGGPSRSLSRVGYSPVKQWSVNCGWASSRPSYPIAL